ncbi:hypothetical protein AMK31_25315 [Streptomyces sp. TSRI0107]|nr:hypothetical protein AMK31_25315 [Streptomyces sp. TSRI0107]
MLLAPAFAAALVLSPAVTAQAVAAPVQTCATQDTDGDGEVDFVVLDRDGDGRTDAVSIGDGEQTVVTENHSCVTDLDTGDNTASTTQSSRADDDVAAVDQDNSADANQLPREEPGDDIAVVDQDHGVDVLNDPGMSVTDPQDEHAGDPGDSTASTTQSGDTESHEEPSGGD